MKETRKLAFCSMMVAVSIVVLLLGAILDLGMYAAPLFAGLFLLPIGRELGRRRHAMMWIAVSLLSFILVPNIEENLMYAVLFGPYPILRPLFEKLGRLPRIFAKFGYFNIVVVAVEALVTLMLVPEVMGPALAIALLALGNLTFLVYDFLIPRAEIILCHYLRRITNSFK